MGLEGQYPVVAEVEGDQGEPLQHRVVVTNQVNQVVLQVDYLGVRVRQEITGCR